MPLAEGVEVQSTAAPPVKFLRRPGHAELEPRWRDDHPDFPLTVGHQNARSRSGDKMSTERGQIGRPWTRYQREDDS